jgi:hypothetical protein
VPPQSRVPCASSPTGPPATPCPRTSSAPSSSSSPPSSAPGSPHSPPGDDPSGTTPRTASASPSS